MPLTPQQVDADARFEAGRRDALIAHNVDGVDVEHKPVGQTSPDNYPYTYHWVRGWNAGVDEITGGSDDPTT